MENVIDASARFKAKDSSKPNILEQDIEKAEECLSALKDGLEFGHGVFVERGQGPVEITPSNLLTGLFCDEVIILIGFETLSIEQKTLLAEYITGVVEEEIDKLIENQEVSDEV